MSKFLQYTLSPGAVASLTEPTPDLQRNYRQRGMMDDYGQADASGRWKYCLRDLVGIWIGDRLVVGGWGMDRREALRFGNSIAMTVISAFCAFHNKEALTGVAANRYLVVMHDGYKENMRPYGSSLSFFTSLSEIEQIEFDYVQVIDLHRLARTIPAEIQGLLIAADENEARE